MTTTTSPPPTTTTSPPTARGSSRRVVRRTGLAYLGIIATGIAAEFVIRGSLVVDGDAATTARNIADAPGLFGAGIAADLVMVALDVTVAIGLFRLLRHVDRRRATVAAVLRLVQGVIIAANLVNLAVALGAARDAVASDGSILAGPAADALAAVERHAVGYDLRLEVQPGVVHPGAAADPAGAATAQQRRAQRRRRGGVADAHLAHHQKIGLWVHRGPAGLQRLQQLCRAHRRGLGEILGRAVQIQRMHIHPRASKLGKLVDRSAAMFEVQHHLRGHLRREGRNPLRRHAVVARKDDHLRRLDVGTVAAAPARVPDRQVFEPSQGPRRLGQLAIALLCSGPGSAIGGGGGDTGARGE